MDAQTVATTRGRVEPVTVARRVGMVSSCAVLPLVCAAPVCTCFFTALISILSASSMKPSLSISPNPSPSILNRLSTSCWYRPRSQWSSVGAFSPEEASVSCPVCVWIIASNSLSHRSRTVGMRVYARLRRPASASILLNGDLPSSSRRDWIWMWRPV